MKLNQIKIKLKTISTKLLLGKDLIQEEETFIFDCLRIENSNIQMIALQLIIENNEATTKIFIDQFDALPPSIRNYSIPLLSSSNYEDAYIFLFSRLIFSVNENKSGIE